MLSKKSNHVIRHEKWKMKNLYESHLCTCMNRTRELGGKFRIEFVRKFEEFFASSLFSIIKASMQTSDPENLFFLRTRTAALLYCVPLLARSSCFPHSRDLIQPRDVNSQDLTWFWTGSPRLDPTIFSESWEISRNNSFWKIHFVHPTRI